MSHKCLSNHTYSNITLPGIFPRLALGKSLATEPLPYAREKDGVVFSLWVMSEPVQSSYLTTCFLQPLLQKFVLAHVSKRQVPKWD
jgi:hypothetical protein